MSTAKAEWNAIHAADPVAAAFLLARIHQVSLASDPLIAASPDLYDPQRSLYFYAYRRHGMYYLILRNNRNSLDVIVLAFGDITQNDTLYKIALQRGALAA